MEPSINSGNFNITDDNIDIKRYVSLFISNWYWFGIALFLTISFAYGINRYSEKVYTVSSTMLIKDAVVGGGQSNAESVIPGGDIFKSQQNLINEMGILRSFSLNYRVMQDLTAFHVVYVGVGRRGIVELKMYKNCPFKVIYNSLETEPKGVKVNIKILSEQKYRIKIDDNDNTEKEIRFGERYNENGFDFYLELSDPENFKFNNGNYSRFYFYFTNPEALTNEYRNKLVVGAIEKEASLVSLSVSGTAAFQEADYINKLMEVYIRYGLEIKKGTADSTIKFIDNQIKVISDSLSKAEDKLELFRKTNRFFDITSEGALIPGKLEKFEFEKSTFELQLQYFKYLFDYLYRSDAGGEIISPSLFGLNDQGLASLITDFSNVKSEKKKLSLNITINQPALTLLEQREKEAIKALEENIKNGMENIKLTLGETEKKIADLEVEIKKLPATERELINIRRKFDLNNTVYTYLLEKRAESGIARASTVSDNRIIDYASGFRASMVKPKVRYNYMIAMVFGLVFPMILIVVIDYFNDRIIDKSDIEKRTKVPVIGYISHSEGKNEIHVAEKPGSSLSESFRAIRTAIKYYVNEQVVPVISVSSTISSEGKTFISINLAAIYSILGKKVLLIGLDLRKPRINRVFEFESNPGMSSFLSGNCEYDEVIKPTQIKNLFYASSGPIPPNPAELIEGSLMKEFLDRAKKEYDYIIIDTPPVAIVTDALLLAKYVDINLFIVRQRYSSRNTLELVEQLRIKGELKNMGIIINDISLSGYYGYGMRYGYALGYGYSYGYNYYGRKYYGSDGYSDKAKGYYSEE
jgi:capsular exopolysaccharide synthesis family protein